VTQKFLAILSVIRWCPCSSPGTFAAGKRNGGVTGREREHERCKESCEAAVPFFDLWQQDQLSPFSNMTKTIAQKMRIMRFCAKTLAATGGGGQEGSRGGNPQICMKMLHFSSIFVKKKFKKLQFP
jgi:hypothetical protein